MAEDTVMVEEVMEKDDTGEVEEPDFSETTLEEEAAEERPDAESPEVAELKTELLAERERADRLEGQLAALREQLSLSVARYRSAALASAPDVPEELVHGETVEEVEESLAVARRTVESVRQRLLGQARAERVPVGAPVRGAPDVSRLSPREKIAIGLARVK